MGSSSLSRTFATEKRSGRRIKNVSENLDAKIDELIRRVEKMETIVELIRRQLKISKS